VPSLFQWLPCGLNCELADSAIAHPSKRKEGRSRAVPGMVRVTGGLECLAYKLTTSRSPAAGAGAGAAEARGDREYRRGGP